MNGPEHYAEAERIMQLGQSRAESHEDEAVFAAWAQVHATLALAAATIDAGSGQLSADTATTRSWSDVGALAGRPPVVDVSEPRRGAGGERW